MSDEPQSIARAVSAKQSKYFFIAACVLCIVSAVMLLISFQLAPRTTQRTSYAGLKLNTPVTTSVATVTVLSRRTSQGSGMYAAPAGKHYEIINVNVENRHAVPIMVAPASDTYLKTTSGEVVYLSPVALDNPFRSGQLLPGETISGELSYLIDNAKTYKFYIDSDWSGGVLPFLLN